MRKGVVLVQEFWLWFVGWGWLFAMIAMSVVLIVQMVAAKLAGKQWGALRILGAFTVIVLTLHVWEEWVIPGGFHYIYNIESPANLRSLYPMSEITDMITNFGGAILWFALVEIDKYGRKMGFAVMLFGYFEFIVHNYLAYNSMTLLYGQGIYSGFYAPGLVTAILCWLPLSVAHTIWFAHNGFTWKDAVLGIVILVVMSQLLVTMPESLFKSEDNPYSFENAGWYEQYIDPETHEIAAASA
jgi:hypothetical protein